MFPLRDSERPATGPRVLLIIIGLNVAAFLWQMSGGEEHLSRTVSTYGLRPALAAGYVQGRSQVPVLDLELSQRSRVEIKRPVQPTFNNALLPFIVSMFLHGGLFHLLGNMWFLWIFGDNVESRAGRLGFLIFYLAAGLAAGICHVVFDPGSSVPCVGASGAISGVLGGYMVLFPRARILTLVPIGFFLRVMELPAPLFLLFWFGLQVLFALTAPAGAGGVAWWAHIGGFLAGLAMALPLAPGRGGRGS